MASLKKIPPNLYDGVRWKGLRIGLLGGSFNPPHDGHVDISLRALKALNLDFVWWLVSPCNPLKNPDDLASYDERLSLCRALTARHPSLIVSDLERRTGTTRSVETASHLLRRYPHTDFIWICGTDNAAQFHRWYDWRGLLDIMPFLFVSRPPALTLVRRTPVWLYGRNTGWLLTGPQNSQSSTALRDGLLQDTPIKRKITL